jgi:hypothetical protein
MKIKYNKLLLSSLFIFAAGLLLFLTGCEGPEGPSGKDSAATCKECHNGNATDINTKFAQYGLSKHSSDEIYEQEAGNLACDGCHTGDGFAQAVTQGTNSPSSMGGTKIDCQACHPIHTNYDTTDFRLRVTTGFNLLYTNQPVDFKTGNTCARCHQARNFTRTVPDTFKPAAPGATYSRTGPHYGIVANVLSSNGLFNIPGNIPYDGLTPSPHYSLPQGCVSCHMQIDSSNPATGGHTFNMQVSSLAKLTQCYGCHPGGTEIAAAAMSKQNAIDLATYRRLLINKGWLDTSQALPATEADAYNVIGEYVATPGGKAQVFQNATDVNVILNYLLIAKDRSLGAHNPKYIQALIKNGVAYLGGK